MQSKLRHFAVALASVATLVACGKKEPPAPPPPPPAPAPAPAPAAAPPPAPVGVAVSAVTLGKAVGGDKKVSAATETFAPKDTIYASVDTTGSGTAKLVAKWTYTTKDGKTVAVKEDSATITPTGPATSEFHISKPDGWPVGTYQVEISADGKSAGSKTFQVK
jgi:hypothetical protein